MPRSYRLWYSRYGVGPGIGPKIFSYAHIGGELVCIFADCWAEFGATRLWLFPNLIVFNVLGGAEASF